MSNKALSKKTSSKQKEPVRILIKQLIKEQCGTYRIFYEKYYGHPPQDRQAIQTLTNYINRGALTPDILRNIVRAFDLQDMRLDDFLSGELVPTKKSQKKTQTPKLKKVS